MEQKPKPSLNLNLAPPKAPSVNLPQPTATTPNANARPAFNMAAPTISPIDQLVNTAKAIDPVVAADMWFKSKVESCLAMNPNQWISWAEGALQDIQAVTTDQADLIRRYNMIDASKWIDGALAASNKKRGFFDRLTDRETPGYYEAVLNKASGDLRRLHQDLSNIAQQLPTVVMRLRTDILIIQVVSGASSDQMAQNVGTNRMKTLLAGSQTVAMVQSSIDSTLNTISKQIQDIDNLQMNVIPAWKLVEAQQR